MSESLNVTKLLDWLEGRLPEEEAGAIAHAVGAAQEDDSLNATVTWLRSFLDFARSTVLVEPPDKLLREAISYFRTSLQARRQPGWMQRLVATLTSDSWQRPSLVGVRYSGLDSTPRQLVYEAATADIVLNTLVRKDRNSFNILGQVFPTDRADLGSFTVQLIRAEREAGLTYTDEIGKFTFTDVPAGIYTLMIQGDQAEIMIASIELLV